MNVNKKAMMLFVIGVTLSSVGVSSEAASKLSKAQKGSVKKSPSAVATKEYKVNGIMAWSEAKKNGFEFYPMRTDGNKTGVGEKGKARYMVKGKKEYCHYKPTEMLGGINMLLKPCYKSNRKINRENAYAYFYLFFGKKLKRGWKIKNMKLSGPFQWTSKKWKSNTDSIQTSIKVTNSKQQGGASTVQLKELTLIGPANQSWQEAFNVR